MHYAIAHVMYIGLYPKGSVQFLYGRGGKLQEWMQKRKNALALNDRRK